MYYLKHLPRAIQDRWNKQLMLQHDVDIKRLWRRSPQSVDSQTGGPPMLASGEIDWPYEPSSSSDGSSSESSSFDSSSSSSSESDCPQCVTVSISGMTGDCVLMNGAWNLPLVSGCEGGSPHYLLSKPLDTESPDSPRSIQVSADYDASSERWSVSVDVYLNPGTSSATYASGFGVGIDWEGALAHETGCEGDVSITTSSEECPEDSSSSSSSDSSSASSSSSSPSGSSASSSGSSSSSSSDDPGSSESDDGCHHTALCIMWYWGMGWQVNADVQGACGREGCSAICAATIPSAPGYNGLYAWVRCNGQIDYFEA